MNIFLIHISFYPDIFIQNTMHIGAHFAEKHKVKKMIKYYAKMTEYKACKGAVSVSFRYIIANVCYFVMYTTMQDCYFVMHNATQKLNHYEYIVNVIYYYHPTYYGKPNYDHIFENT